MGVGGVVCGEIESRPRELAPPSQGEGFRARANASAATRLIPPIPTLTLTPCHSF